MAPVSQTPRLPSKSMSAATERLCVIAPERETPPGDRPDHGGVLINAADVSKTFHMEGETIYGLVLILCIIFLPSGIYGSIREAIRRRSSASKTTVPA